VIAVSFIKGVLVGMGASIPLGPLGVMCVQKTLSKGRMSGFFTGLGASISDTFYAAFAIAGLALIQEFVRNYEISVLFFGGLIVMAIGLKIFLTNPVKQIRGNKDDRRLFEDFISSFIMTVTNPGALFLILGLFAFVGVDVNRGSPWATIISLLAGVFAGALGWWLILSNGINLFRKKFRLRQLLLINRISGAVIMVLGFITLLEGLYHLFLRFYSW